MDDIIITLLTLAFIIVAAVNQSKNKKRAAQTGQERIPDFPEGFFGEKRMEPESRQVPGGFGETFPGVRPVKKPAIQKENRRTFDTHEEGERNEIVTGIAAGKSDEIAEPYETDFSDRFSLKNAVIFSEILRPKYF